MKREQECLGDKGCSRPLAPHQNLVGKCMGGVAGRVNRVTGERVSRNADIRSCMDIHVNNDDCGSPLKDGDRCQQSLKHG